MDSKSNGFVRTVDITNQRFGRLVAVKDTGKKRDRAVIWLCKCDCGNFCEVRAGSLRAGTTKSCGCLFKEVHQDKVKISQAWIKEKDSKEGTRLSLIGERQIQKNNKSGTTGVHWVKSKQKWRAAIQFQGKVIGLGYFKDKQDAIKARKEAEEKYFKPILEKYGKKEA